MATVDRDAVERALRARLEDRDRLAERLLECEGRAAFLALRAEAEARPGGRSAAAMRDWQALWSAFGGFAARVESAASRRGRRGRLGRADAAEVDRGLAAEEALVADLERRLVRMVSLVDQIETAIDDAANAPDRLGERIKALENLELDAIERWRQAAARISRPRPHRPEARAAELRAALGRIPAFGEPGWIDGAAGRLALERRVADAERRARAAREACERPLRERNRLRVRARAYRARAARLGREDAPGFAEAWRHARTVLWTAPCSLPEARAALDQLAQRLNGDHL